MRRAARKTNSTYASRQTGDDSATPTGSNVPAPMDTSRKGSDSQVLHTIASRMTEFAEGLTAANRLCEENKARLDTSVLEAQAAIAEGRAASQADNRAAALALQQQLDLRPATTASLKNPGNDAQYVWNCTVLNILTVALTSLELNDPVDAKEKLRSAIKEIVTRNKHINIADESAAGWGTIREYTKHSHAEDDADDAKIRRCEATALAKMKKPAAAAEKPKPTNKGKGRGAGSASTAASTTLDPFTWALLSQSAQQYTLPSMPTLPALGQVAPAVPTAPRKLGPCYTCQGAHLQRDCPYYKAQNAALQAHLASTIAAAPGNSA